MWFVTEDIQAPQQGDGRLRTVLRAGDHVQEIHASARPPPVLQVKKPGDPLRLQVERRKLRQITEHEDGRHAAVRTSASYVEFRNPDSRVPKRHPDYAWLDEYHAVDPAATIDRVATLFPDLKGRDCCGRDPHWFLADNVFHH